MLGLLPTMLFAGQQQSINRIITFGDSLSDAGNKHLISLYMHQATKGIIGIRAMPPNVSARYSNGFTWVDQLNISLWRQPSTPALNKIVTPLIIDIDDQAIMYPLSIRALKGTNWAIGGAMAGEGYFVDLDLSKGAELTQGGRIMPNIGQQIKDFEQSQTHFQPSDLIILQGGTNNLWFTLFGDVAETGSQTALKLIRHIKQLRALGAQHILLMNLPPFQHGATLHPYADETQRFVDEFNQTLNDQLPQFTPQQNRPSNVYLLDVHRIFTDMIHSIQTKVHLLMLQHKLKLTIF